LVLHQPDDSTVVTRTIHIAARPETVFAFFIDPLKMRQWKGINATLDPHPQGQFQVALNEQEIDLVPDANGTFLRLCHRGLPTQARSAHEEGWDYYLPRLALAAEGGDTGADPRAQQH